MDQLGQNLLGDSGWVLYAGGLIPGYAGYADTADRAETDRRFREQIVQRLDALRAKLGKESTIVNQGESRVVAQEVKDQARHIADLEEKVQRSRERLSAFFNAQQVQETDIDALYAFDRKILDQILKLEKYIELNPPDEQRALPPEWHELFDELDKLIDERQDFIDHMRGL